MSTAIAIAALLVVPGLIIAGRRRSQRHIAERRNQAQEHRGLANATELEAHLQAAEAEERVAQAKREQLAAERHRLEAERNRAQARDLHTRADELDPDSSRR